MNFDCSDKPPTLAASNSITNMESPRPNRRHIDHDPFDYSDPLNSQPLEDNPFHLRQIPCKMLGAGADLSNMYFPKSATHGKWGFGVPAFIPSDSSNAKKPRVPRRRSISHDPFDYSDPLNSQPLEDNPFHLRQIPCKMLGTGADLSNMYFPKSATHGKWGFGVPAFVPAHLRKTGKSPVPNRREVSHDPFDYSNPFKGLKDNPFHLRQVPYEIGRSGVDTSNMYFPKGPDHGKFGHGVPAFVPAHLKKTDKSPVSEGSHVPRGLFDSSPVDDSNPRDLFDSSPVDDSGPQDPRATITLSSSKHWSTATFINGKPYYPEGPQICFNGCDCGCREERRKFLISSGVGTCKVFNSPEPSSPKAPMPLKSILKKRVAGPSSAISEVIPEGRSGLASKAPTQLKSILEKRVDSPGIINSQLAHCGPPSTISEDIPSSSKGASQEAPSPLTSTLQRKAGCSELSGHRSVRHCGFSSALPEEMDEQRPESSQQAPTCPKTSLKRKADCAEPSEHRAVRHCGLSSRLSENVLEEHFEAPSKVFTQPTVSLQRKADCSELSDHHAARPYVLPSTPPPKHPEVRSRYSLRSTPQRTVGPAGSPSSDQSVQKSKTRNVLRKKEQQSASETPQRPSRRKPAPSPPKKGQAVGRAPRSTPARLAKWLGEALRRSPRLKKTK